jgi:hypothetical protein
MKIYTTLAKAINEAKNPTKNAINPHFKNRYATLDVICDDVREVCKANGIAVIQTPTINDDGVFVLRAIAVSGDESITLGDYPIRPTKDDPQGYGSAITYARRYQICAIFGIAAEEDDDGNAASAPKTAQAQAPKPVQPKDGKSSMNPSVDVDVMKRLSVVCAESMKMDKVNAEIMKTWFMDTYKSDLTKCEQSYIEEILAKAKK